MCYAAAYVSFDDPHKWHAFHSLFHTEDVLICLYLLSLWPWCTIAVTALVKWHKEPKVRLFSIFPKRLYVTRIAAFVHVFCLPAFVLWTWIRYFKTEEWKHNIWKSRSRTFAVARHLNWVNNIPPHLSLLLSCLFKCVVLQRDIFRDWVGVLCCAVTELFEGLDCSAFHWQRVSQRTWWSPGSNEAAQQTQPTWGKRLLHISLQLSFGKVGGPFKPGTYSGSFYRWLIQLLLILTTNCCASVRFITTIVFFF